MPLVLTSQPIEVLRAPAGLQLIHANQVAMVLLALWEAVLYLVFSCNSKVSSDLLTPLSC